VDGLRARNFKCMAEKNLTDMNNASQRRHGYTTPDGSWTDKGYDRATNEDFKRLEEANKVVEQEREKIRNGG
jgi:hypothetical protein